MHLIRKQGKLKCNINNLFILFCYQDIVPQVLGYCSCATDKSKWDSHIWEYTFFQHQVILAGL